MVKSDTSPPATGMAANTHSFPTRRSSDLDQAVERLDQRALPPPEALPHRGEAEVLVTTHGHAHADEDAPHEEPARELVGVEPGTAEVAAEHVGHLAHREAHEEEGAQHHEAALHHV